MHQPHDRAPAAHDPAWFKSSYSSEQGGNCIEGARLSTGIAIRDSKDKAGPSLVFSTAAWQSLINSIKSGRLT
ncbi:hypothetical protein P3T36_004426 [Kitasatospora sp. MAP12-15]|uniref:DUF397 domain-containing protein n=1 Tax=unclassified Kitasatospora TaxID=2633591 RepID=UPI0024758B60|nr:DUF397 domain-containing protein [Kitasatospora sp. MAP12-44]MDH6110852.1 hypothetical protein [Kitasatospora sp. MAP12-44]